jgi:hypothetical protein
VELPRGVALLVENLRELGFAVVSEDWHPARGSGMLELARTQAGVSGVRIERDRACGQSRFRSVDNALQRARKKLAEPSTR